jgi:starch-binding outer membrane protein, SusD/RagB family
MKRRLNLNILFVSMIIFLGFSCEDYLDTNSKSTFTEETVFSNLDFATKAVLGVYDLLTGTNFYAYSVGFYYGCDNDIEHVTGNADASRRDLARFLGTDGNPYSSGPWNLIYQSIERANICIDNLPVSPIWEGEFAQQARRLYGEAKTLRALCYFELIRHFGDVPFSLHSTQDGDNFYLPKTDRDSIYEYLIEDLKEAESYVPWMREIQTVERINKGFVKGLRARMALAYSGYSLRNKTHETRRGRNWEKYYQIAHEELEELVNSGQHQLYPNYEDFFKSVHAYKQDLQYGESLFEIGFGRLYTGRVAQSFGMGFTTNPAEPKYGRAAAEFITNPYYYYSFDKSDLRREVNCALYNYASSSFPGQQRLIGSHNGWKPSKWRKSWIVPAMGGANAQQNYTGVNWPLMRYTDVVLLYAETENELNNGPTQAAKNAIAAVRKRAFTPDQWDKKVNNYIDSVSVSKEDFFNALVNERAWEFGGELLRKYDLVRWNLLGAKLKEMREENLKILNNDPKYQDIPNRVFWRTGSDGETLEILNPDYRISSSSMSGWSNTTWLSGLSANNKTTFTNIINLIAAGYDETKNNHLFPIAATVINDSNGVLNNDQIP